MLRRVREKTTYNRHASYMLSLICTCSSNLLLKIYRQQEARGDLGEGEHGSYVKKKV